MARPTDSDEVSGQITAKERMIVRGVGQSMLESSKARQREWEINKFRAPVGGNSHSGWIGALIETYQNWREGDRQIEEATRIVAEAAYQRTIAEDRVWRAAASLCAATTSEEAESRRQLVAQSLEDIKELSKLIGHGEALMEQGGDLKGVFQ